LNLNDPKLIIKDFQKLSIAKNLPTISFNTFRNRDVYQYGGFMDKDIPMYYRNPGTNSFIIGLEDE
jgi:hypothetical protein